MKPAQVLLSRLLEKAERSDDRHDDGGEFLLVLDGEGLEDLPEQISTRGATLSIHRVATEIRLRHLLWKSGGAPFIAVLPEPLAQRMLKAPDLLRRARNQRVHALSVNDVLEVVLGARVVGAEQPYIQDLAMKYVTSLGERMALRTLPTVVDRRLLTEMLIDVSVGEQVRTSSPALLLAAWIVTPPDWSSNVVKLVTDALPTMHGDEGRLLAWALQGEAERESRLRALVVHGAILTVEADDLPKPAWGPLWKAAAQPPLELDRRILRRALTRLAEETLALLRDTTATDLLEEADRVGRQQLVPAWLQTSRVLPLAFLDRAHAIARDASEGKPVSAADIAWLADHRAVRMHRAELAVLESMARVSRWLAESAQRGESADILTRVSDYQANGAFADLAMAQLRRALAGSPSFHHEAERLLTAARERRDDENLRFAQTLAAAYEKNLHSEGVTPLHRLWKRVVAPLWQADPKARLYLVVLDGCSYPVFLDLLTALASDSAFPVGISSGLDGPARGLPALSPLPTITSHARGAIFLGELPSDPLVAETVFAEQDEAKTDRARFAQSAALGRRTRRLFLKGDIANGGRDLVSALGDESLDVVAVVFNAVDDQIGSANTGTAVRVSPDDIVAFRPALNAALKAGRKVLVTADHGHSPFVDKQLRVGAGATPRWLPLADGDAAPDGFLEIDLKGLGGPPQRRAFAWKSGAYLGNPQVGFHGGCSLEEMVVPLAWLERDGVYADEPVWWYGQGVVQARRVPTPIAPPLAAPVPSDDLPPVKTTQLTLFAPADALPLPEGLAERLQADERRALVLLSENGTARLSELAERLGRNPGRLGGMMRTLRRTLHAEGVVVFTDELLPGGETLYRWTWVERSDDGASS